MPSWRWLALTAVVLVVSARAQERTSVARPEAHVGDQLIVNYFESDPDILESHLVITDVEGSGPVVNVLVYDTTGTLQFEESYHLPIFGKVNYNPVERFGNRRFTGSIQILADGGSVGAQYWKFYRKRGDHYGELNTALPGMDARGTKALVCEHFVADPHIDAKLILVNPNSDSDVVVSVTFAKDDGKQLTRDRHRIGTHGSIVLNPYKENEGIVTTGIAYCEVISGRSITGEYWQQATNENEYYQVSLPLDSVPIRKAGW